MNWRWRTYQEERKSLAIKEANVKKAMAENVGKKKREAVSNICSLRVVLRAFMVKFYTAAERMVETLFEDIFRVDRLDPDGKKFDRVNRIEARSDQFDMYMLLDVNTEVYPMHVGEKFMMVLASTLNLDGTPDSGFFSPGGRKSLADKFDYVMHGKLYRISEEGSGANVKADIYVSFGGLLMLLKGDPSIAAKFELDQRLFILMRKVKHF
ncbi:hypothetical protein OSB04_012650 [Centaurea solstitialis]|uniref:DNA-directed RNA polymerases I, II, and III subunit RPABC3 n=1 Tax=Centaurea solstitialis TaxID=347529 RepID=A0AA38WQS7_9ASTR|nr:hypothetical protein OSB04_012650 [Centaurea solstitialis]